jgi:Spy/CpxP family protein refolding chaperone
MNGGLKWKLAVGFLLVFIAGATTGAFFGATHARHVFFEAHRGILGERMRERLRVELNLTPDQVSKISPIVDKTAAQLEQTRRETGRRVHELFSESHRQIAEFLTPEQRAKLQQMEARHRRFMEHRRDRHGPPPHGPPLEEPE